MADPLAESTLDFSWGERRSTGVVFHRQNARVSGTNRDGAGDRSEAPAAGSDGEASANVRDTAIRKEETLMLPHSTHTLLFTEDVCSLPFFFAMFVLFVSFSCLGLALWDGLGEGSPGNPLGVPVNVSEQVRAAQFLSVLVALTMEEEIPTGTYMLRMMPRYDRPWTLLNA